MGEVYFRFFHDTTDSINYTRNSQRWFYRYWDNNAIGVRDDVDYAMSITPGKRRITFLGDSFTAGQGIKKVGDRFVNHIRARHPEQEIHMLAELGLDTDSELAILNGFIGHHYQADRVVLVYCLNDVSDLLPEWVAAGKLIKAESRKTGWLVQNSYFLNTFYYRWKIMRNPYAKNYFAFIGEGYQGAVWERQKQQLHALHQLVESNGGQLLVVTFPFLNAIGPNYPYAGIHQQLNDFWRKEKVPHLDLLSVYKDLPAGKLTVNHFDAHPNEYAHQLATEAIDQFLTQNNSATNRNREKPE